jgi:alginate O-acetyltransferase complex protein AlgI
VLFNSFEFILFFATVVLAYYRLPHRWRWVLLLIASYAFYMSWRAEYALLILGSTFVDYWVGLKLEGASDQGRRRRLLALSLLANLGTLFFFKYWGFFSTSVEGALDVVGVAAHLPHFDILLPVGISFYTFQSMSYTIDVYRGQRGAERHFGIFAVYVAFFPQLVAGPIERSVNLLPQFFDEHRVSLRRVSSGLQLMVWGIFKKVVVADNAGEMVDKVYESPELYTGPYLFLATFLFSLQIYCDFSGYSDVAIGASRIMGFDLMTNFRRPYFSRTLAEFWRRWHISLSTWFRDYVYLPLGGNRVSKVRHAVNLLVVFVVSGLWHGAAWTFIIWGALHGVYLVAEVRLRPVVERWPQATRDHWATQLIGRSGLLLFVLLTWVFFRAEGVDDAWTVLSRLPVLAGTTLNTLWTLDLPRFEVMILALSVVTLIVVDLAAELQPAWLMRLWARRPIRWSTYMAAAYAVVFFGSFGRAEFIYFQF